jgi:hypothetical protein
LALNEKPANPATVATTPPINIHIALSVGDPVKNREKSEPIESDALTPNMINMMPTTSSTSDIGDFILIPPCRDVSGRAPTSPWGVTLPECRQGLSSTSRTL